MIKRTTKLAVAVCTVALLGVHGCAEGIVPTSESAANEPSGVVLAQREILRTSLEDITQAFAKALGSSDRRRLLRATTRASLHHEGKVSFRRILASDEFGIRQ